jgi:Phosphoserine phosphatase RsbU, N-terminal domain
MLAVTEIERLQRNYRTAFLRYLPSRDEAALHLGYEIGRAALAGGLSLLDLAQVHHRILIEVLPKAPDQDIDLLVAVASDFLLEALAAYELARRCVLGTASGQPGARN